MELSFYQINELGLLCHYPGMGMAPNYQDHNTPNMSNPNGYQYEVWAVGEYGLIHGLWGGKTILIMIGSCKRFLPLS